jgi:hypothetical protein
VNAGDVVHNICGVWSGGIGNGDLERGEWDERDGGCTDAVEYGGDLR